MLGMGSHFEIWDAAKLAESEAQAVAEWHARCIEQFFLLSAVMTENTVPELQHRTVLLDEAVDALALVGARADGIYVDGTFGRGGHRRLILTDWAARAA